MFRTYFSTLNRVPRLKYWQFLLNTAQNIQVNYLLISHKNKNRMDSYLEIQEAEFRKLSNFCQTRFLGVATQKFAVWVVTVPPMGNRTFSFFC